MANSVNASQRRVEGGEFTVPPEVAEHRNKDFRSRALGDGTEIRFRRHLHDCGAVQSNRRDVPGSNACENAAVTAGSARH
jgi:hypothetical protein